MSKWKRLLHFENNGIILKLIGFGKPMICPRLGIEECRMRIHMLNDHFCYTIPNT